MPKPEDNFVTLTSMLGASTGSISVDLQTIPSEPIRFMADPTERNRLEDSIIAWTWRKFIDNPINPYELVLMPMTKASVRAMDVVQQFATQLGIPVPETFVISGASKRGWTTWTTAAVDNVRVIGAIPIVMDMADFQKDTFWQELQLATGGTYLRRLPNADHSCAGHEISLFWTMRSFYLSIYENKPLPSLRWMKTSNNTHGYIRAIVDFSVGPRPMSAYGYHARTLNDQRFVK
ncbi:unnamed protein product [Rotaria sp. Silwood1]|nr:unnamed protein product [Rotaria sp. Silwood1]CAF4916412.1 unnamed protein product [Rotaria sp. Silwood1]